MKRYREYLNDGRLAFILIIALVIIDQIIKIEVKTHMCLGESIKITDWFFISFIENNGMAYGMTFVNKLFLSLMRIVAVYFIGLYMIRILKKKHRTSFIIVLSFIMAGALGNIFDSMFYGLVFNASSPYYSSYLVPFGHGYAPFLMGKVVDMFYFPLIVTTYPDWIPFKGGEQFIFFSPVFNFADACISVGVVVMFLFFRKDLENISEVMKLGLKNKKTDEKK